MDEGIATPGDARFGEAPLAQTVAAASAMRRLGSLLLSLEHAHPTVDAMIAKFAEWESELASRRPPRQRAANRFDPRRPSAYLPQPRHRHRCLQPMLSRVPVRSPRCREGSRPGGLPADLRRAARVGAWRLPRCLLRLRDSASQLRYRPIRQDAVTGRDLPPSDSAADRAWLRYRALADRPEHHVDRAAVAQ